MLAAAVAAACSGSDDEDPVARGGTCDRTAAAARTCMEVSGDPFLMAQARPDCEEEGGVWSAAPCPAADLIGCCSYTFELQIRECFYPSQTRAYDPATMCTHTTFNGVTGVWTPAP